LKGLADVKIKKTGQEIEMMKMLQSREEIDNKK